MLWKIIVEFKLTLRHFERGPLFFQHRRFLIPLLFCIHEYIEP